MHFSSHMSPLEFHFDMTNISEIGALVAATFLKSAHLFIGRTHYHRFVPRHERSPCVKHRRPFSSPKRRTAAIEGIQSLVTCILLKTSSLRLEV